MSIIGHDLIQIWNNRRDIILCDIVKCCKISVTFIPLEFNHKMRTSRIARDTAKAAELLRTYDSPFRRQTRSSLSSLVSSRPQNEISSKDDAASELPLPSTPSPLSSTFSSDIEDLPCSVPSTSRKRKRIAACTPTTAVHSDSKTSGHHAPVYKASGDVQSERRGSNSPSPSSAITQTKKVRRPATKTVTEAGKVIIHPPLDWEAVYDAVKETRSRFLAPVDTMGCESLAEVHRSPRVRSLTSARGRRRRGRMACGSLPATHHSFFHALLQSTNLAKTSFLCP